MLKILFTWFTFPVWNMCVLSLSHTHTLQYYIAYSSADFQWTTLTVKKHMHIQHMSKWTQRHKQNSQQRSYRKRKASSNYWKCRCVCSDESSCLASVNTDELWRTFKTPPSLPHMFTHSHTNSHNMPYAISQTCFQTSKKVLPDRSCSKKQNYTKGWFKYTSHIDTDSSNLFLACNSEVIESCN